MTTTAKKGKQANRFGLGDSWKSFREAIELFYEKGWTDGFPVIPPTDEDMQAMLSAVKRDPQEVIGVVPPRLGVATVESVAANAVMAGCKPEYLKVVLAAVEAMLDEHLNLNGVQATTNACAPLAIVSGPVVQEIGLNSSTNLFGHGYRANATIGRAVRLVMTVLGGGYPETGDKSPLGMPGKFSYCIAESPDSPWEPLHVERGTPADQSGVTMVAVDAPRAFTTTASDVNPVQALHQIAREMTHLTHNVHQGGEVVLVLNPLVAEKLAKARWTKEDIKWFMYEKARVPLEEHFAAPSLGGTVNPDNKTRWPMWLNVPGEGIMVPVLRRPENLIIVVAGGTQLPWSAFCGGWGYFGGWSVSRPIRD